MAPLRLRLRELRESRGMTQQQLAASAGVRQATISDLETGRSKGIGFATAEAIARVLHVSAHELFETVPERQGP